MPFVLSGCLFGLFLLGVAQCCWRVLPRYPELWRTLPRERRVGFALGVVGLLWAALLAYPLFEGGLLSARHLLLPAVAVVSVASYMMLDYLFTRAVGGLLILIVNALLHAAFVAHCAMRPLFAVVCYAYGIVGIFMIAKPYRFRDALERCGRDAPRRAGLAAVMAASGLAALVCAVLSHG